ncbi:MAG: hypothetical protein HYZ93_02855, partial [Candidatus Omnitrophica bacterium]|nr:hypothetical protein [Candidatus Omnitrophota bacterium]
SALAAVFGIVVTAFYMLRGVRTGFLGSSNPRWAAVQDATPFERLPYLILITALLVVGCWPRFLTDVISASTGSVLSHLNPLRVVARL